MAKTKIVATLGPASDTYTVLRKMMMAGLDVARLNFSHGTHKTHLDKVALIKKINKKYRRHIRLLQDLEGFRIRIGKLKGGEKLLNKRDTIYLTSDTRVKESNVIPFDYKHDLSIIGTGELIYIDDGNIILKVKGVSKKRIKTEVIEGGLLKDRKGLNIPGVKFPVSGITHKDKQDMEVGIEHKFDYIAQSFVRTKKDIDTIKKIVKARHPECQIIAKIEAREAIKNIDEIIDVSDGIMVARGDMGVAVPIYKIAMIQKDIIRKCKWQKKFVITATQMLEHMTEHSRPTRAEVTDVTNAILDGTDYVMLSAESASGKYPVESVKMMNQICRFTEGFK